jgi:hypothetical protein
MADGHLNKCKECAKKDVQERYQLTKPERAKYDRQREKSPARKASKAQYQRNHRATNPERTLARGRVAYAIRTGKLARQGCEVCGEKAEAHHEDYNRPLEVKWLCFAHHRAAHGQKVS